ncbi:MAG: tRNA preQ1(34) S-adenosylmethionine ribosyltransferase-isomerase QueA [Acidiferrobacterales bacterium]|nr:tRNA preQ1(34) S-adenosylmethionine ribosyltransferase-isomerase QueA [Acidiferrobacterales bacterium]
MKVADFDYHLPAELIAQFPLEKRTDSRLLHVQNDGKLIDRRVDDVLDQFNAGDLLVLNNTKVIPARLFGQKDSGGRIEILLERIVSETQFLAQIRASRSPKNGQTLLIDGDESVSLTMLERQHAFFLIELNQKVDIFDWLQRVGHIPLPPYIERADQVEDVDRYQTVFAQKQGAVAAPTAGLHYDEKLLKQLQDRGVKVEMLTLHVGAGTYQPVRCEQIDQHVMHSEWLEVSQSVCDAIIDTKLSGKRVIAVGTTVVRSLETAAQAAKEHLIEPYRGETDIFIFPGFKYKVVDLLQTNFHLPQSTLMMLVSAFAGYDSIMQAYRYAVDQKYRFFSYGDSMLLEKKRLENL